MSEKKKRGPKTRLSAEKRERFLEVLGQTGNRRTAAEAIGVEPRLMDQRRRFDPLLDRQWKDALDQAERRLAGAAGPTDCIGGAEPMVIRRGPGGRARIVKAGARRWSAPVEARFLAVLAASGNISGSARAVGFSPSTVALRRRKFPPFAARVEEALADAEISLEFRLLVESGALEWEHEADGEEPAVPRFDPDLALRILKWREAKRLGIAKAGRNGRVAALPPVDEVRERILRKVAAIKRHRQREEGRRRDAD
jgi:hypothetical protein